MWCVACQPAMTMLPGKCSIGLATDLPMQNPVYPQYNFFSLPSGNINIAIDKWPFIGGVTNWKMVIFHSYVSLPEGTWKIKKGHGMGHDSSCMRVHPKKLIGESPHLETRRSRFQRHRIIYNGDFLNRIPATDESIVKSGKHEVGMGQNPGT